MKFLPSSWLACFLLCGVAHATLPDTELNQVLWYPAPAEKWTDALPLGNGRLGAMVFGGVDKDHLQLNEDTLYSGEPPADRRSIDLRKDFDHVTGLRRKAFAPRNGVPAKDLELAIACTKTPQASCSLPRIEKWA